MGAHEDAGSVFDQYLTDAVTLLDAGRTVSLSIRDLIAQVVAERRGSRVIEEVRAGLDRYSLETDPDFTAPWIDTTVAIRRASTRAPTTRDKEKSAAVSVQGAEAGPAVTIGSLQSASAGIFSVEQTESIELARTRMLRHDVSQLAVMSGPRQLIGAVTWESIAIAALGQRTELSAATIPVSPVQLDADLIALIPAIVEHGFVFVLGTDRRVAGIVTTADLGQQFASLARPFLLLGEIERRLRHVLTACFSSDDLASIRDPQDADRSIESANDLTLGEVVRFIGAPDNWTKLKWPFDRSEFIKALDEIRAIRNEVMHFSPDPLSETQDVALLNFVKWLRVIPAEGLSQPAML